MTESIKLPVGIESFEEIRSDGYYYVDKTKLIEQLVDSRGKVNLFTRPRRFGKTLNMSMLKSFFEIGAASELFDGLYISHNKKMCDDNMGKYPVIFLSLKNVEGLDFQAAKYQMIEIIAKEAKRFVYLKNSDRLDIDDKSTYASLIRLEDGRYEMRDEALYASLQTLSELLYKHHGRKTVILIDEYDVPLAKASANGYYPQMLELMKSLMSTALKDNSTLRFATITGCLKIAKESIFTGTNNFVSDTISSSSLDEYFGFTQADMEKLLLDADMLDRASQIKAWYDGYHFGASDVYCPWDVMNYLLDCQKKPDARPIGYWKNTSDNAIIRSFIDYAGSNITMKLEALLSGGYILQHVEENLTYDYLHSSEDNLWSILYLTGYLTQARIDNLPDGLTALMIPNAEIREIFESTILKWFNDSAKTWNREQLFYAVWHGNTDLLTQEMNALLRMTISYHDYKEDFYHAFLAGIFAGAGYVVESNREHGEGRSDVVVYDLHGGRMAIFEAKYSKTFEKLSDDCDKALRQIDERMYAKEFEGNYDKIFCYGISFFKKRCMVKGIGK